MNAKPNINQKNPLFSAPGPGDWCQLQHVRTLMGLSRRRFSRDEVLRLIDTRAVQWAWDISRKDSRRAEVRIWRESLLAYLAAENGGAAPASSLTLAQVIAAVLPRPITPFSGRAVTVRSAELQRRFLCCAGHVARLIADGELSCAGGGSKQNPAILYQSAFEFLRRRTMSI